MVVIPKTCLSQGYCTIPFNFTAVQSCGQTYFGGNPLSGNHIILLYLKSEKHLTKLCAMHTGRDTGIYLFVQYIYLDVKSIKNRTEKKTTREEISFGH